MQLARGNVAVVTGGASGIGFALADRFATAGLNIVLADVQDDALDAAAAKIGGHGVETLAVRTDVSKEAEVQALAAATIERFGGVHIVCNNAGVASRADPWFGPLCVGVGAGREPLGRRPRLPRLPARTSWRRRPHREHGVDRRAVARVRAVVRRQQARRRRDHREPVQRGEGGGPAHRRQRAVPGVGEHQDRRRRSQLAGRSRRPSPTTMPPSPSWSTTTKRAIAEGVTPGIHRRRRGRCRDRRSLLGDPAAGVPRPHRGALGVDRRASRSRPSRERAGHATPLADHRRGAPGPRSMS